MKKRTAVASLLFLWSLLAALPAAAAPQPPPTLRLYVFDCGTIVGMKAELFGFKDEELPDTTMAVPCYLIVHPKGTLVWDTGAIPDSDFKSDGSPASEEYFRSSTPLLPQLAQVGYTPKDITYLAMSHYHMDHSANSNLFAGSTWLVQKKERAAMFVEPPPPVARPAYYSALKTSKTIEITTPQYDVFGDGSVIIVAAPGHTVGHQVLLLKLKSTGPVMLVGDLYHYPQERTMDRVPTFEFDAAASRASRRMVEALAKKTGAQIWIEHDLAFNKTLRKAPGFYD
jgi:glyoxylase-like metal-dependent hydrolase (beta-lactamase superfamily II)